MSSWYILDLFVVACNYLLVLTLQDSTKKAVGLFTEWMFVYTTFCLRKFMVFQLGVELG